MKKLIALGVFAYVLCSFTAPPQPADCNKSARQVFEENLSINIERCVRASVEAGQDSVAAYNRCKHALKKAFEIDSTFYNMDYDEQQKFIDSHRYELMME